MHCARTLACSAPWNHFSVPWNYLGILSHTPCSAGLASSAPSAHFFLSGRLLLGAPSRCLCRAAELHCSSDGSPSSAQDNCAQGPHPVTRRSLLLAGALLLGALADAHRQRRDLHQLIVHNVLQRLVQAHADGLRQWRLIISA